jgi:hypothetical protein
VKHPSDYDVSLSLAGEDSKYGERVPDIRSYEDFEASFPLRLMLEMHVE